MPAVAKLMRSEWMDQLAREGTLAAAQGTRTGQGASAESDGEHLPCPACGTAAALVEGACSDCGLVLE